MYAGAGGARTGPEADVAVVAADSAAGAVIVASAGEKATAPTGRSAVGGDGAAAEGGAGGRGDVGRALVDAGEAAEAPQGVKGRREAGVQERGDIRRCKGSKGVSSVLREPSRVRLGNSTANHGKE